jgi:hypothetical protein
MFHDRADYEAQVQDLQTKNFSNIELATRIPNLSDTIQKSAPTGPGLDLFADLQLNEPPVITIKTLLDPINAFLTFTVQFDHAQLNIKNFFKITDVDTNHPMGLDQIFESDPSVLTHLKTKLEFGSDFWKTQQNPTMDGVCYS